MKKIIYVILLMVPLIFSGCWTTSEGKKIGQITAIAQQGLIIKTWEAQIVRGGINNGSGVTGQVTHFTVENNPELVKKLTNSMNNGTEVEVTFHEELVSLFRSESGSMFADSAEIIERKGLQVQDSNNTNVALAGTSKISKADMDALSNALINILNKK